MPYHIVVCDDEKVMVNVNSVYIKDIAEKLKLDIVLHTFTSGTALLDYAQSNPVDIAFLDIDLEETSGISVAVSLRKLNAAIVTVFITGHTEYALDAFDTDAAGYLVKPLNPEKLEHSIKKAVNYIRMQKTAIKAKSIVITENNVKKKIPQHQILYFEKEGNQCRLVTVNGTHYWYATIKMLLDTLDHDFMQINQGVIVNCRYIKDIVKGDLILKNGEIFPVGRRYLTEIKERFLGIKAE